MTDAQAAQIKELRMQGEGYRAIGAAVGLSRDIVRNYCKAHWDEWLCQNHCNEFAGTADGGGILRLDKLIRSELSPIRPDRHVERKLKIKSYIRFNYRIS